MPVHPSEENAPSNLTEAVAKNPSSTTDSTASHHESHANEHTPLGPGAGAGGEKPKAQAHDFMSKGPQIPLTQDDLPPKASREEQESRFKELNQPTRTDDLDNPRGGRVGQRGGSGEDTS